MKQQAQLNALSKTAEGAKKKYFPPKLSEYGNIATVTQNMMSGGFADVNGKLMMNA